MAKSLNVRCMTTPEDAREHDTPIALWTERLDVKLRANKPVQNGSARRPSGAVLVGRSLVAMLLGDLSGFVTSHSG